jgi:hypothetical protein
VPTVKGAESIVCTNSITPNPTRSARGLSHFGLADSCSLIPPGLSLRNSQKEISFSLLRMQAKQSGHRAHYLVWCNILSAASYDT